MQTKKYPGRQPGHKENGTSDEQNLFDYPQYTTPESLCQTKCTFVSLTEQAETRMAAAFFRGDYAGYLAHSKILDSLGQQGDER